MERGGAHLGWLRALAIPFLLACLAAGCASGSTTPGGSASATPSATAVLSATPALSATTLPSETASSSASPTPAPTPTASPTASPTAAAYPLAAVTFNDMELDAAGAAGSLPRTFQFQSRGPGKVTATIAKTGNAADSTRLCVSVDGGPASCKIGNKPSLAFNTIAASATWKVEAISTDAGTPIVDIALSWPTNAPAVTLTHGRLQGSGAPEQLNGFNVTFKPRTTGKVSVGASWTVIVTDIDIGLADVSGMPWINVDEKQYYGVGKINPPYTYSVVQSKTYRVMLRNLSADNYRPDLTAQISFP